MAGPTAFEQQMLEYINRARSNPAGEFDALIADAATRTGVDGDITDALRYFEVDLNLFRAQIAGLPSVAPLNWNEMLATGADRHTALMIQHDDQSHNLPGEAGLSDRLAAAGYRDFWSLRENVYAYTEDPVHGHAGFFIDWGGDGPGGMQDPAGHRTNILSERVTEIGIGAALDANGGNDVGPWVVTQNFGRNTASQDHLLGVVIKDGDGDRFYDMGEGMAGVTITARAGARVVTTTSWDAGGYQLVLTPGTWTVTFSGGGLVGTITRTVTMGDANIKVDAVAGDAVTHRLLLGDARANLLAGTAGDDVIVGRGGADTLVGGAGHDILVGERLDQRFDDAAAQVYRLYQATLGRAPGHAGLVGMVDALLAGASPAGAAAGLMASAEFRAAYGATTNLEFVTLLFENVLGRAPAAAGLAAWTQTLAQGASRASVVLDFADSAEFAGRTAAAAMGHGRAAQAGEWADDAYRIYQAALDRAPSAAVWRATADALAQGRDLDDIAASLIGTGEFRARFGALTDAQFVGQIFRNALDRAPDAASLAAWTRALAAGTVTRADVVEAVAQGPGHVAATTQAVEALMRAAGVDDRLAGGAGANILVGGFGADTFMFDRATGGTHRVADLEAWDSISLRGFGFANAAQAMTRITQSGDDAVFSHMGTVIVFEDTRAAWIDDDMILV